jgi:hypothetical protein
VAGRGRRRVFGGFTDSFERSSGENRATEFDAFGWCLLLLRERRQAHCCENDSRGCGRPFDRIHGFTPLEFENYRMLPSGSYPGMEVLRKVIPQNFVVRFVTPDEKTLRNFLKFPKKLRY